MVSSHFIYRKEYKDAIEALVSMKTQDEVIFLPYGSFDELKEIDFSDISHIVTAGSLPSIKEVLTEAISNDISVGIVPLAEQNRLRKTLDLPNDIGDAYLLALNPSQEKVDIFYCNDTIVIKEVRIGNTSLLKEFEYNYTNNSIRKRVALFCSSIRKKNPLRHHRFSIKIGEDKERTLSAIGMIGLDYDNRSWVADLFESYLNSRDGQYILAILSPASLFQHFIKQPIKLMLQKKGHYRLPKTLGFVKSSRIEVDCDEPLEVVVDDSESMQTPVILRSQEKVLSLSVGERFWERQLASKQDRNNIRLDNIPKDDENIKYLSHGLPLFEHASREQYASLFSSLREDGALSSTFVILLILATMIATLGLFINSSSVIIGAMLLAPLMQPIVSLSMGALRQDSSLEISSARTILIGILIVLITSALIALALPIQRLTPEMLGRLSPTILDLFVAIVSGVAAAYVKSNDRILGSLAGVAIAVALVPPIAVSGVGLGWADWGMFSSAFLLFVTNLVGIVLAASLTFMVLGFSPIAIAKKGILIWLAIVALTSIPLYSSFAQMQNSARIQEILTNRTFISNGKQMKLTRIELAGHTKIPEVHCDIVSNSVLTDSDKAYLKKAIVQSIGQKVVIIATFRYRLE